MRIVFDPQMLGVHAQRKPGRGDREREGADSDKRFHVQGKAEPPGEHVAE